MIEFNIFVQYNVTDPLIVAFLLLHIYEYYNFYLKYYTNLSWVSLVEYTHCCRFNSRCTSSCILSIEKLRVIIYCKTQSKHAFSDRCVHLVMLGLLNSVFSFDTHCQSVNGSTPGD